MKSKTLGSNLTAISLLKLTSTTFVAPPHLLLISSEKLGTFYLHLLRNVVFTNLSLQNGLIQQHSSQPTLLRAIEFTTVAIYSRKVNCQSKNVGSNYSNLKKFALTPIKRKNRPFALRGHLTSFLGKWKLYDFAFEKRFAGHILNEVTVIWFFKPAPLS